MSEVRGESDRGMDLVDLFKVLWRQWLVLLIGVVVTAGAGLAVIQVIPPTFQASGQLILLLKPEATGEETPTNPYLNLDSNLTTVASLLAASQSTPGAQEDLVEEGFVADTSVTLQPGVGPVISISTAHTDPSTALRTRDAVIAKMQADLDRLQDDAQPPERQRIVPRLLSTPQETVQLSGSKIRALAAVAALGGLMTLLVAMLRDRRERFRREAVGQKRAEEEVRTEVPRVRPKGSGRRAAS